MRKPRPVWWWVGGAVVLLGAIIAYAHFAPRWKLDAYKAELRAEGVPLTTEEVMPPRRLECVEAARRFFAAASALPNLSDVLPGSSCGAFEMLGPGQAIAGWRRSYAGYEDPASERLRRLANPTGSGDEDESGFLRIPGVTRWEEIAAEIDAVDALLDEISSASEHAQFDWDVDYSQGFNVMLPYLVGCKNSVQWLTAATQLALHERRYEDAIALIETQLRLTHNMDHKGLLIDELVRIAMAAIAWNNCWAFLQVEDLSDEHLFRLQRAWEGFHPVGGMIRAFQQERGLVLMEYERCRQSPRYMKKLLSSMAFGGGSGSSPDNFVEAAIEWVMDQFSDGGGLVACVWWGWFDAYEDQECYIRYIQDVIETAERRVQLAADHTHPAEQLPPDELWVPSVEDAYQEEAQHHFLSGIGLPSLDGAMRKAFQLATQREIMLAAIALKRRHLRQLELPDRLAELVPGELPAVPLDWMDGTPLKYRLMSDVGFVLYSVGSDGNDDGGSPESRHANSHSFSPSFARDFVWPQEVLPPFLGAADLESGLGLSSTHRGPETVRLRLRTNAPPAWITVLPWRGSRPKDPGGHVLMGLIDVSTGSPPARLQSLDVWGADPSQLESSFQALDLNFDGYPDLLTVREPASKAVTRNLWLYDPASDRFVTNTVTAQFGDVTHHTLSLDRDQHLIRMTHFSGICTNSWETWDLRGDQLLNIEASVHVPLDRRTCQVTHLKRFGQEMRIVEEQTVACVKGEPELAEEPQSP